MSDEISLNFFKNLLGPYGKGWRITCDGKTPSRIDVDMHNMIINVVLKDAS